MLSLKEKLKEQVLSAKSAAAGRIAEKILGYAAMEDVDEIIIEAGAKKAEVRFYDTGEVKGCLAMSEKIKNEVIDIFKELGGLKNGCRTGSFKKQTLGKKIIFSLTVYNSGVEEKIIVKVANSRFDLIEIGRLGLEKKSLARVKLMLEKKSGLILSIGQFNSGKTSTLYSFINYINCSDLNITTLEKQISYDIPNINQSELSLKEGFGYPFPLSSLLRQDPDVVMIDEIVDKDATEAALHLADRGYFVLAGLYGDDFASVFKFLSGLGVSLPLFCATAKMIIIQRLARRNCPYCLKSSKLTKEQAERIKETINIGEVLKKMRQEKINSAGISRLEEMNVFKGQGCEKCRRTGLAGDIGIFEVLEITASVKKSLREGHFSTAAAEIKNQDSFTLAEAAFAKLSLGVIGVEEFLRIVSI
ncbi:MAG: ATPase, T2SS/T4P/T4SS family [Patescibacteria group bacterium]|jgi:type IV pilus assembly protein PilB